MIKNIVLILIIILLSNCGKPVNKNYYLLSYQPDMLVNRLNSKPYPITLRLKPFTIEKAYSKPNIVYRNGPYQLEYYGYQHWAVRPKDMITDLIYSHLTRIKLVNSVVKRLDEKGNPDYELSGTIQAIEEYDSEELWFAHLAIRVSLTRLSDGEPIYNRLFDQRKMVETHEPIYVVRTLSELTDYFASQLMNDIDSVLNKENLF